MFFDFISWQSIVAGAITALAVSIVLAVLGVALGFSVIKPSSRHPFDGLGATFGVWSVISVVASLAVGGFVAGAFSGARGLGHGFMVWATVLLAATLFGGHAIGSAVRSVGSVMRSVGSGAASVVSTVGGGVSSLASSAVEQLKDSVNINLNYDEMGGEVASVLRDTGIETLQPDFLKQQMREAKSDLKSALHQLSMNSEDYEDIIGKFLDQEKARLDGITGNVDKNAAVNAIMNHRHIPREEAEKMVNNALKTYQQVVDKSKETLADAQNKFNETRQELREMGERARVKADGVASTAAKSALAAALALILGAIICSYAGRFGGEYYPGRILPDNTGMAVTVERTMYGQR